MMDGMNVVDKLALWQVGGGGGGLWQVGGGVCIRCDDANSIDVWALGFRITYPCLRIRVHVKSVQDITLFLFSLCSSFTVWNSLPREFRHIQSTFCI